MGHRVEFAKVAPEGYARLRHFRAYVTESGLEPALIDLVWLRISQINGCAYCVDLHSRDALEKGVSARKLFNVATWWESPMFTRRERAALRWAESLTRLPETGAPDDDYAAAAAEFADKELADLSYAIALMNALNRLGVGFRMQPQAKVEENDGKAR